MGWKEDLVDRLLFGDEHIDGYCNIKVKGKRSICSTCKYFNGETCKKQRSFAGFASKLDECNNWEVCNGLDN